MKRVLLGFAAMLITIGAQAQETQQQPVAAAQAATTEAPAAIPALVPDTSIKAGDSDLVRAAKTTLARRQKARPMVIDNKSIKTATGSRVSEPTQPLAPIKEPSESKPIVTPPMRTGAPPAVEREAIAKHISSLKKEQERLHAEELEAPYSESDEGATAQKLSKIQTEIDKLQKSLNEPANPPQQ
jgi:hypothetical protein